MWYPAKAIGGVTLEPATLEEARQQCRVDGFDSDGLLTRLIGAARDHVEKYCGMRFAERSITSECDSFEDFAELPDGPLKTITTIKYVDDAGVQQTLADSVYQAAGSRFAPIIELKADQEWPEIEAGSRIELAAIYGGNVPESVKHAILLLVGDFYRDRESTALLESSVFDALLTNDRRGIYS